MLSNPTFSAFINTIKKQKYMKIYKKLGCPAPFDVSLRDGLQGLPKTQQETFTLDKKKFLLHGILQNHNPHSMEIGSIISNKVLPIFKDTKQLLQYACLYSHIFQQINQNTHFFVLIPNKEKLNEILLDTDIPPYYFNFSFINSVSNGFQKKNTKKTIDEMRTEITHMIQIIQNKKINSKIKVYISCINECPIEGRLNNNQIIDEILKYKDLTGKINNICLSDTMGTLLPDDFTYIVDNCNQQGIPFSKFALHLHVKNPAITENIFYKALDRNITQFDVSDIDSGGCSVTMDSNKLTPNLSYTLYYEFLTKYICNYKYNTKII